MKELTVTFVQQEVKVNGKSKELYVARVYFPEYDKTVTMSVSKFLEMAMSPTRKFKDLQDEEFTLGFSLSNTKTMELFALRKWDLGLPKGFTFKEIYNLPKWAVNPPKGLKVKEKNNTTKG